VAPIVSVRSERMIDVNISEYKKKKGVSIEKKNSQVEKKRKGVGIEDRISIAEKKKRGDSIDNRMTKMVSFHLFFTDFLLRCLLSGPLRPNSAARFNAWRCLLSL